MYLYDPEHTSFNASETQLGRDNIAQFSRRGPYRCRRLSPPANKIIPKWFVQV